MANLIKFVKSSPSEGNSRVALLSGPTGVGKPGSATTWLVASAPCAVLYLPRMGPQQLRGPYERLPILEL